MTHATSRLGEILRDGDKIGLRYERRLAHPQTKVWQALTESEHLEHWFPADIVGPRESGAALQFKFWAAKVQDATDELEAMEVDLADPVITGKLLTWDPPRVFEILWGSEHLHFELAEDGDATRLVLTVWPGGPGPRGLNGTAAGYHVCLDALVATVDGEVAADPERSLYRALEDEYAQVIEDSW